MLYFRKGKENFTSNHYLHLKKMCNIRINICNFKLIANRMNFKKMKR